MLTEMNSSLSSTLPNIAIANIATILGGVITASLCRHIFPCQSLDKAQREYLPGQAVGNIRYVALKSAALIYALLDFSLDYSFEIRYLRYAAFKRRLRVRAMRHTVVVRRPRTEQICPQFRKPLTVKLYLLVKVVQLRQLFKRHLTASSRVLSCFSISGFRQCQNGHRGFSPPVWTRNTQCSFGHISGTAITHFQKSHFNEFSAASRTVVPVIIICFEYLAAVITSQAVCFPVTCPLPYVAPVGLFLGYLFQHGSSSILT